VGTATRDAPPYPAFPPNQLPDYAASVSDIDTGERFVHNQNSSVSKVIEACTQNAQGSFVDTLKATKARQ